MKCTLQMHRNEWQNLADLLNNDIHGPVKDGGRVEKGKEKHSFHVHYIIK